nr:lysine-rich arabinogalactan protein 19-like [Lolium perenne]
MEPPPTSALPPASSVAAPAASLAAPPPIPATAVEHPPLRSGAEVAAVVAATHVDAKRRRVGQHVVQPQPATAPAPPVAPPPTTKGRWKTTVLGLKKPAGAKPAVKKTTSRKNAASVPTITDPPPACTRCSM